MAKQPQKQVNKKAKKRNRTFACTWEGCTKKFPEKQNMQKHVRAVHMKIADVACTEPGCDKMFTQFANMQKHVNAVHLKIKDVACTEMGCGKVFTRLESMEKHVKAVHRKIKDIACTEPGCTKTFSEQGSLTKHVRSVHMGIRDVHCSDISCDKTFDTRQHMTEHYRAVHLGIKDFECTVKDCSQTFTTEQGMTAHIKAVHLGIREVICTETDCNQTFVTKQVMQKHVKAVHLGIKDIKCTDSNCDQMFSQMEHMRKHFICWHTVEGMQRKIKKQDKLKKILEQKFAVDTECRIRYKNGCVPNPDRFYSRIDFHIQGITDYIVIVENDEFGHVNYLLSCELSRMDQISEAIMKSYNDRGLDCPPIVFIRFNCDASTINGIVHKTTLKQRHGKLISYLEDVRTGQVEFTDPVNIVYMNYDMITVDGDHRLCLTQEADFSEHWKGVVRTITI